MAPIAGWLQSREEVRFGKTPKPDTRDACATQNYDVDLVELRARFALSHFNVARFQDRPD
jgi:hypothetical protein